MLIYKIHFIYGNSSFAFSEELNEFLMSISNDTTTSLVFIQIIITIQKQQLYHLCK